ncbi:MAG: EF-hand domain-containing protein [Leptolyngbyaceae bacterium]|nr:EF-hand domain-containing protein [Leptolyngbyaceae bacterium]
MVSDIQKRKLLKLFAMYDGANSGTLNINDFESLAQRLAEVRGWKHGSQEYLSIENKYLFRWNRMKSEIKGKLHHKVVDNKVTVDEWIEFHEVVSQDKTYREQIKALSEAVFNAVDVDESGFLDKEEWKTVFRVYNIPVVYVDESFAVIDRDGNGKLSKDELTSMLEDFYFNDSPDAPANHMFGPL